MEKYEKSIVEAREQELNKRFANSTLAHAKILLKEIILDAENKVSLLSCSFNTELYSDLEKYIDGFLSQSKTNIFELITSYQEKDNELLKKLSSVHPENFKVFLVDSEHFPVDSETNEKASYIVNDNNAFRYQYSSKDIKYGVVKAIANFNSVKENKLLVDLFERIKGAVD